jgi:hypothetical protein
MKRGFLALGLTLTIFGVGFAQEHPEHPKADKKQPPPAAQSPRAYSMDELEKAITADIEAKQKKNDGWYRMKDDKTGQTLKMKLDHVHRERLSKLDPKTYFACTDFKTADGHTVDVDFFMKDDGNKLVMTDSTVHKIDGKPRYNWAEKDGFWVRVPVGKS